MRNIFMYMNSWVETVQKGYWDLHYINMFTGDMNVGQVEKGNDKKKETYKEGRTFGEITCFGNRTMLFKWWMFVQQVLFALIGQAIL